MAHAQPQHIRTITEFHSLRGLPKPQHPLVSVVDFELVSKEYDKRISSFVNGFYSIALKKNFNGKIKYGQQQYDFDEGVMVFMAPGQVLKIEYNEGETTHTGLLLLLHPGFLNQTALAQKMGQYGYFGYATHEALHLSEYEEGIITSIMHTIRHEYESYIDQFSHDVIIAQLELLFTYADRFYHRQFLTRKAGSQPILQRLEDILNNWFNNNQFMQKGLPTVQYVSGQLNVSPNYLSGLLKVLTGQSTQQHIQSKVIEKAKVQLSCTALTVSEIAYQLGFEHPQSFNKLFKSKTNLTPLEFRQAFN